MSRLLSDPGFVHLHVHSSFSLLEGAMQIAALGKMAAADGQPALALTDTNNLFGALEFSEKMVGLGIQPIAGAQLSLAPTDTETTIRTGPVRGCPSIVLLAATQEGYANLMRLTSASYLDIRPDDAPHLRMERIAQWSQGLIALTGGSAGPVNRALRDGREELAGARLTELAEIFGDRLYVELQRHDLEEERRTEPELLRLAYQMGLPIVATNEPYFAKADDFEAHDALLAIADGRLVSADDRRRLNPEYRYKTRAEMAAVFADLPEALRSTIEIAMRCSVRPRTRKPILPRFGSIEVNEADELKRQAHEGLDRRLAAHGLAEGLDRQTYRERLDYELSVIERMQYPGYFLIVSDFIKWAKAHDIPVGPGRGSGAGSLVAYSLTITDLDPLRFGLLFERFLNPERVSMPDFDIDFCQDRREEVIAYVQERYGADKVAQIITFGTLQARGVMRDVGRVLEMPYGQVDKLTKLVPNNPANPVTLAKAIEGEPKLQSAAQEEAVVGQMLGIAQKLEGLHRHASTHAAGIVIGDRPLEELVPLYKDPRTGMRVSQFNMKWVEQAGLVKFDFLGLKTLTVLETAVRLIRQKGMDIDLSQIPMDDAPAYELLARGETVGVFQVESAGMRKALLDMKPDRIEDIIALVALYRPGPMDNIPEYNARKRGEGMPKPKWYLHAKLETSLRETFGIIVYQEQVMQAAQELSGYSLGDADLLRRAMGKKIKAEMDAQRDRFVKGAIEHSGLSQALADEIFDLLAKFADYGFNKSHAAAYGLISYQTAYLKANHPVEFLAALMTLDMDNTDKLAEFRRDAQRLGISVEPPLLNRSGVTFEVHADADGVRAIRYALAAIKGVGRQAVESLVAARGKAGPFRDLGDLGRRLDPKQVNKRTLENLICAGALDDIEPNRARACAAIDGMMALAQRTNEMALLGQNDMFGSTAAEPLRIPPHETWLPADRLQKEYDAVGFFLTGHPLDEYGPILEKLRVRSFADFAKGAKSGGGVVGKLAATVLDRSERRTKSGSKMGIVNLSDRSGQYEAILFSEALQRFRDDLEPGRAVVLMVQGMVEGDEVRVRINSVEPLDVVAVKHQKGLRVFLRDPSPIAGIHARLQEKGEGEVSFILILNDGAQEVEVKLPGRYSASPQIASAIRAVPGVISVDLH